jgi:serine/threonine protein kinase
MAHGELEIGSILAGRYRVERVLGRGGMGIVVRAMHLQLHQPVAVKLLLPEMLGNQQIVERFLREAQAVARLRSEHVARVIDVGALDTGVPYMVLEYLEGTDLASFPRSQLTVGEIVDVVLQACEALAEAHSIGIVHRDIKPGNLFITLRADGTRLLKVLDFGISKIPAVTGQLTATQSVIGTPTYMSPEQMRSSRDVDHRSDIWSLGIVLYELLQGAPPFGDDAFPSLVLKVVNDPPPRLTVRLPGDLEAIIYRCLEKDPAKRFQNVAQLAHALAKYAQSEMQAAVSVQRTSGIVSIGTPTVLEPNPSQRAFSSTISGSVSARTMPQRRIRRWPIAVAMAALTGAITVAVAVRSSGKPEAQLPSARPEGPVASPPPIADAPASPPPPVVMAPALAPPAATTTTDPVTAPAAPAQMTTQPDASAAAPKPIVPSLAGASSAPPAVAKPPGRTVKKPARRTNGSPSLAKPGPSPMKPPLSDDDVLGTRK